MPEQDDFATPVARGLLRGSDRHRACRPLVPATARSLALTLAGAAAVAALMLAGHLLTALP